MDEMVTELTCVFTPALQNYNAKREKEMLYVFIYTGTVYIKL